MNKKLRSLVVQASEGIVERMTDLVLFNLFLFASSFGKGKSSRGAYQALVEANQALAKFNYQTLKNAVGHLRRRGLITSLKEGEITAAGRRRLRQILPRFEEKRTWDGSLYLVTYDIPESRRVSRERLRQYLKSLGMGMVQRSVWVTPYNPTRILAEFVKENGLEKEMIIVAKIGRDGFVGEKGLREFLWEIYGLEELNERYRQFLEKFKTAGEESRFQVAVGFWSILKDDPQLPWELLPEDWLGKKAYRLYKQVVGDFSGEKGW